MFSAIKGPIDRVLSRRLLASFGAVLCVLLLAVQVQAAPIIIDNFADPTPEEFGNPGDSNPYMHSVTGSAGVLGGDRDFTADWIGEATIPFGGGASIGDGHMQIATASITDVVEVTLDYPSIGGSDITDGGANDTFRIDFGMIDTGSLPTLSLDISVTTSVGVGTFTGGIPASPGGPTFYLAPFAAFTGTYDFSDVSSIAIVFNSANDNAIDFEVNGPIITTSNSTPEPASVVLLLMGLSAASMAGRRRRYRPQRH